MFAQGPKIDKKFQKWPFLRKTCLKADPHYGFRPTILKSAAPKKTPIWLIRLGYG